MEFHIKEKAKIERWFKTMKEQWMSGLHMNDYKSLDELRESLMQYVQRYNQTDHSQVLKQIDSLKNHHLSKDMMMKR